MQEALHRAGKFLEAHGSALDRARLDVLLGAGSGPARAALEALQREGGSFPALPGRASQSEPCATAAALVALAELRVRRATSVERAVQSLVRVQSQDGSWGAGDLAERLTATGRVGAAVGRTLYARPEVLSAAGAFLGLHFAPEYVEGGAWQALAGVAAFYTNVADERADAVLQWCGRALEKGFRSRRFSAERTARVLTLCDAGGLPGATLDVSELVMGVLAEQADDGGWPAVAEGGGAEPGRAEATLDAAFALVRLTR